MCNKYTTCGLLVVVVSVGLWNVRFTEEKRPQGVEAEVVLQYSRDDLTLHEGVLYYKNQQRVFSGVLVESFSDGSKKSEMQVEAGRLHGVARGWYENGQLEVEESFVKGVSHGERKRWYKQGGLRSTSQIAFGEHMGMHIEWHPNGQKSKELLMRNGQPEGVCMSWYPSGKKKSQVEMQAGQVVARQFWEE